MEYIMQTPVLARKNRLLHPTVALGELLLMVFSFYVAKVHRSYTRCLVSKNE